ncbi:MAG TPA: FlgO family outer membrane protein [Candidatus Kapabacteria bacterium]|nr:FlgO family outer membrane protein [Candidatus Kapabacteria bacterium]
MKKISILVMFGLLLSSCSTITGFRGNTAIDIPIKKLALMLNDSLRRPALKNQEMGVLTFVNLNNLDEAGPLGRHLQEKLSYVLFDLGFRIIEIRAGKDIRFQPLVGELNMTRINDLLKETKFKDLKLLVMGTYIDAGDYIYVNAKLVELANSMVKANGEIQIKKGKYLGRLLDSNDIKTTDQTELYERFPTNSEKPQ